MKKMKINFCLLLIVMILFTACSTNDALPQNMAYNPGKIELSARQQQNIQNNNGFALRLFNQVATTSDKSFVISPLSLTYALAMLNNGAGGETQREIIEGLGFSGNTPTAINALCNKLMIETRKIDKSTTIDIANAVVTNEKYPLLPDFTSTITKDYDAVAVNKDFTSPSTVKYINDWCKAKTHGMIPEMVEKINPDILTILLNAVYFKGQWWSRFEKNNTHEGTFTPEKGNATRVQMMHQTREFAYNANDVYRTLVLPYGNGSYQMVILLPVEGKRINDVLNAIDARKWANNINNCTRAKINLSLPRFTTTYAQQLNETLKTLGMKSMFDPSTADLSRLSPMSSVVSLVFQKAKIEVDEQGTQAAAITKIEVELTSAGPRSEIDFNADHPFIYAITEYSTGAILFMGVYQGE